MDVKTDFPVDSSNSKYVTTQKTSSAHNKSDLTEFREELEDSAFDNIPETKLDSLIQESRVGQNEYNKIRESLQKFLETWGRPVTDEKEEYTIIDQHKKKKWYIPENGLERFYSDVEKMRVQKIPNGYSARQSGPGRLFIDFDILLKEERAISNSPELAAKLVERLSKHLVEDLTRPADGHVNTFHVLVTTRDYVTESKLADGYKDGFHIYFDLNLPHVFRKHLVKKMVESGKYSKDGVFIDVSDNIASKACLLDHQSATVPPLLIGSTKAALDSVPYSLFAIYEVGHVSDKKVKLRKMNPGEYERWNIAAKFSPTYFPVGERPNVIHPLQSIMNKLESEAAGAAAREWTEEFMEEEDQNINHVNDPTYRDLAGLLALLSPARYEEWGHWSKILMSLAHWGDKYKTLAIQFSRKSKSKFSMEGFEKQWAHALKGAAQWPDAERGIIVKMAQEDDPEGQKHYWAISINGSLLNMINEAIMFMGPKLAHLGDFQMAKIIHTAFPNKYIAVPKRGNGNKKMTDDSDVIYYSLMSKNSPECRPGYAGKYVQIYSTAPIQLWISMKAPGILRKLREHLDKKKQEIEASGQVPGSNFGKDLIMTNAKIAVIGKFYSACQNHGAKAAIMRQFAYIATDHQFEYKLDQNRYTMGVYDGVLEIGVEPRVHYGHNNFKVTRTSLAKYRTFDPKDPKIIMVTQWLFDFTADGKFDKLLFLLIFMCQSTTGCNKPIYLLNIPGGGSNGKSTIMNLMHETFGVVQENGYGYKMGIDYLTQARSNSSAAQSELMPLMFARYTFLSEPSATQCILENKLKTALSGESLAARENYGNEQNIRPVTTFMLGSNHRVKLEGGFRGTRKYAYDHGTLRRILILEAECKFSATPDHTKPNQRKADHRIAEDYVRDPDNIGAFLSLLSIVYALYIMQHNESILEIRSPNVAKETDEWRRSFDTLDTFINSRCIKSDANECNMTEIIDSYIAWHDGIYGPMSHDRDQILHAFYQSKLEKFIKTRGNTHWATGIRVAANEAAELAAGESRFMLSNEFDFKDYRDYKMPAGLNLPFMGKIEPTKSAANFLEQLDRLHKAELADYRLKHPETDGNRLGSDPAAAEGA